MHKIERYKLYLKSSLDPFCLNKTKVYATINPLMRKLNDSSIFVIIVPANACSACVSSLFVELANSNINIQSLYLIIGKDSLLLRKEWMSFGFLETNCVHDRFDLIKTCNLKKSPVLLKLIDKYENCFFMNYEPGISNQFHEFIEFDLLAR